MIKQQIKVIITKVRWCSGGEKKVEGKADQTNLIQVQLILSH